MSDDIIRLYQRAIHQIDDYFEHRNPSKFEDLDKLRVLAILDQLNNDLLALSRGEI